MGGTESTVSILAVAALGEKTDLERASWPTEIVAANKATIAARASRFRSEARLFNIAGFTHLHLGRSELRPNRLAGSGSLDRGENLDEKIIFRQLGRFRETASVLPAVSSKGGLGDETKCNLKSEWELWGK